jgi:hypothetical protein
LRAGNCADTLATEHAGVGTPLRAKERAMKTERIPVALMAALALAAGAASAQERHGRTQPQGPPMQLDSRYHHDRYYPRRGYVAPALPRGAFRVPYRGGHYFFQGGVWYQPSGAGFVVVTPPLGIVLPFLPPVYATVRLGGAPYYYADGVYYARAPGGYAVVAPPPGAETAQPTAPTAPPATVTPPAAAAPLPAAPEPIFYPRNGQSAAQTERDRRACNRWATTQPRAVADADVFQRAVEACMDGRGYTSR